MEGDKEVVSVNHEAFTCLYVTTSPTKVQFGQQ